MQGAEVFNQRVTSWKGLLTWKPAQRCIESDQTTKIVSSQPPKAAAQPPAKAGLDKPKAVPTDQPKMVVLEQSKATAKPEAKAKPAITKSKPAVIGANRARKGPIFLEGFLPDFLRKFGP